MLRFKHQSRAFHHLKELVQTRKRLLGHSELVVGHQNLTTNPKKKHCPEIYGNQTMV